METQSVSAVDHQSQDSLYYSLAQMFHQESHFDEPLQDTLQPRQKSVNNSYYRQKRQKSLCARNELLQTFETVPAPLETKQSLRKPPKLPRDSNYEGAKHTREVSRQYSKQRDCTKGIFDYSFISQSITPSARQNILTSQQSRRHATVNDNSCITLKEESVKASFTRVPSQPQTPVRKGQARLSDLILPRAQSRAQELPCSAFFNIEDNFQQVLTPSKPVQSDHNFITSIKPLCAESPPYTLVKTQQAHI